MGYRLVATDIDGTLLNERHELTPRTRAAVRVLLRHDIPFVLTTARPARSVTPVLERTPPLRTLYLL